MTPEPAREITVVRLADETIDQLAIRVADLLAQRADATHPPTRSTVGATGLLSAAQVSDWWGVERGWVYQHADQLGAIRLGTGRRPRLRFDPEHVRRTMGNPGQPRRGRSRGAARAL